MIFNGYTNNASLNKNSDYSNYPAVNVTVNYSTIDGYVKTSTPLISPYGYIAIPDDHSGCAYAGVGQYNAACVLGYTNTNPPTNVPSDLEKGEICIVSKKNYAFSIRNKQLHVTFTNGNDEVINTRVTIDENVNTILIDTIAEIAALETKFNTFINDYNAHTHLYSPPAPATGVPTVLETTYTATPNFTRDKSFLGSDGINNFINEFGKLII